MSTSERDIWETYRAAFDYQSLVRLVAVQTVSAALLRALQHQIFELEAIRPTILALVLTAATALSGFFAVRKVQALVKYLQVPRPLWWVWATVFPVLSTVVLVMVSRRIQVRLKAYGVPVGMLGPSNASVYEFAERESRALNRARTEQLP